MFVPVPCVAGLAEKLLPVAGAFVGWPRPPSEQQYWPSAAYTVSPTDISGTDSEPFGPLPTQTPAQIEYLMIQFQPHL